LRTQSPHQKFQSPTKKLCYKIWEKYLEVCYQLSILFSLWFDIIIRITLQNTLKLPRMESGINSESIYVIMFELPIDTQILMTQWLMYIWYIYIYVCIYVCTYMRVLNSLNILQLMINLKIFLIISLITQWISV
jgi:hypothetical protein